MSCLHSYFLLIFAHRNLLLSFIIGSNSLDEQGVGRADRWNKKCKVSGWGMGCFPDLSLTKYTFHQQVYASSAGSSAISAAWHAEQPGLQPMYLEGMVEMGKWIYKFMQRIFVYTLFSCWPSILPHFVQLMQTQGLVPPQLLRPWQVPPLELHLQQHQPRRRKSSWEVNKK